MVWAIGKWGKGVIPFGISIWWGVSSLCYSNLPNYGPLLGRLSPGHIDVAGGEMLKVGSSRWANTMSVEGTLKSFTHPNILMMPMLTPEYSLT